MNLKPLGDRVIVTAIEQEEVTASGIVLPDTAQEKPQRGRVLAAGPGRWLEGERVALEVKAGDEVIFSKYGGTEVRLEGEDVLILSEHDILAKISTAPARKRSGSSRGAKKASGGAKKTTRRAKK